MAARYLKAEGLDLFSSAELRFEAAVRGAGYAEVKEDEALYHVRPAKKRLEELAQQAASADG